MLKVNLPDELLWSVNQMTGFKNEIHFSAFHRNVYAHVGQGESV